MALDRRGFLGGILGTIFGGVIGGRKDDGEELLDVPSKDLKDSYKCTLVKSGRNQNDDVFESKDLQYNSLTGEYTWDDGSPAHDVVPQWDSYGNPTPFRYENSVSMRFVDGHWVGGSDPDYYKHMGWCSGTY
jgi:hypothetical protein